MAVANSILTMISTLQLLAVAFSVWLVAVGVYRIFYHPLSKIPGPRLAALTYLYRFKYNVLDHGRFYQQIERLHQKYGPVIRITPNEIHLSDPDNHDKIHHLGSEFYKDPAFYGSFGFKNAAVVTPSNELHRIRRARLAPLFSRARVLELEAIVQLRVEKLCERIAEASEAGVSVDLHHGFRAVSVDVITDYAWGNCYDLLSRPDLGKPFFDTVLGTGAARAWMIQQFPFLAPITKNMPIWIGKRLSSTVAKLIALRLMVEGEIKSIKTHLDSGGEMPKRRTIFHQLLDPNVVKNRGADSVGDLIDEALTLLNAASGTTGGALTIATVHTLSNNDIRHTLTDELKAAFPDATATLDFLTLEKLPYLTAVIKEALRLSFGVPGQLPRVAAETVVFNGYAIPAGTVVSMSTWQIHRDPTIFPEPDKFQPSRWLDGDVSKKLEKYLVPFGKGQRQCLGMQLAYCELYVTLANVFRRFEQLKLYKSGPEDYFDFEDYFAPYYNTERKLQVVGGNDAS